MIYLQEDCQVVFLKFSHVDYWTDRQMGHGNLERSSVEEVVCSSIRFFLADTIHQNTQTILPCIDTTHCLLIEVCSKKPILWHGTCLGII